MNTEVRRSYLRRCKYKLTPADTKWQPQCRFHRWAMRKEIHSKSLNSKPRYTQKLLALVEDKSGNIIYVEPELLRFIVANRQKLGKIDQKDQKFKTQTLMEIDMRIESFEIHLGTKDIVYALKSIRQFIGGLK